MTDPTRVITRARRNGAVPRLNVGASDIEREGAGHGADREPLSVVIARRLLDNAVTGAPESVLPTEPVLVERLGVSRTVVREAVRLLVAKGVVSVRHGSGMRVRPVSEWRLLDPDVAGALVQRGRQRGVLDQLVETRRLFEVEVAGIAALRHTVEDLASIDLLMARMAAVRLDPAGYAAVDNEFHLAVARATRNAFLVEVVRPLNEALGLARGLASSTPGTVSRSIASHGRIAKAIWQGDPSGAREAMRLHLCEFEQDLRRYFEVAPPDTNGNVASL
ncbi:MAG: FadR family transcriptional regulator [Chloroflexi bacterium]|nr:FadR family transcriptional regulator [Chloroflexota bacterium]